ncbi:MAG: CBS domain-containing protein, partial [Rhodospirillaceae bacterium]|nr:CBS domain-containing protein [Rhodospirillaceae bacterium]
RNMNPELLNQKVSEIMTKGGVSASPDQLASEAVAIMNENKITILFIIQDNKPVGILHIHDCLRAGVA